MKKILSYPITFILAMCFFNGASLFSQEKEDLEKLDQAIELPEILEESLSLYQSLRSYSDSTSLESNVVGPNLNFKTTINSVFLFERPNRLKVIATSNIQAVGGGELYCDGQKHLIYFEPLKQYTEEEAPDVLSADNMGTIQNSLANNFVFGNNPNGEFKFGIHDVEVIGDTILDGFPTVRIDMNKTAGSFGVEFNGGSDEAGMLIPIKLWIDKADKSIRRIKYEFDFDEVLKFMAEEQRSQMATLKGSKIVLTENHKNIKIDPDFPDGFFEYSAPDGAKLVENFGAPGGSGTEASDLIGETSPAFDLLDIDGNEVSLSDFTNKVVLVDFWATWCGPCLKAMPHMQTLWDLYKEEDVVIIGINSWERSKEKVKPLLKEKKITYRILLDPDNKVVGKYGVQGIPTFFLIDKKGVIRYSYTGMPAKQTIQQNLEELLAE